MPDQLHHPSISDAQAQPVHQVMVIDVVEGSHDTLPIISTFRSE
jgi:hypothetical protein